MTSGNRHLFEILGLSERMLDVAKQGTEDRNDPQCGIVFGTLHDYALHLRKLALEEIEHHRSKGEFDRDDERRLASFRAIL